MRSWKVVTVMSHHLLSQRTNSCVTLWHLWRSRPQNMSSYSDRIPEIHEGWHHTTLSILRQFHPVSHIQSYCIHFCIQRTCYALMTPHDTASCTWGFHLGLQPNLNPLLILWNFILCWKSGCYALFHQLSVKHSVGSQVTAITNFIWPITPWILKWFQWL